MATVGLQIRTWNNFPCPCNNHGRLTPAIRFLALNGLVHIRLLFIMSYTFADTPDCTDVSGAKSDLLSKNALTTAGVLVGAGTGVAGVGILFAALPGQMTVATAITGGLLYAGHRQSVGKPIIPGTGKSAPVPNAMGDADVTTDAVPATATVV